MTRKTRGAAVVVALAASVALAAAGCSSGGGSDSNGNVTMTLWQNSTTGPGKAFWQQAIDSFHQAHPNITIKMQAIQNEDLDGKLQTALNSGDAPDIFFQRGGGKMSDMVQAGQVMDLSDSLDATTKTQVTPGVLKAEQIDGKTYAMPVSIQPEGIYYSKDLFSKAGISTPPVSLADLNTDISKLKAKGIVPLAVGAKDAWPAAHYYYNFALRECSEQTLDSTAKSLKFTDPCWTRAGNDVKAFNDTQPFNDGFLTTSSQQGAGSSAGLVANHKAAGELQGAWDPGVIASLTPNKKPLPDLGWFPFPTITGGAGNPNSMMGGADAYSCSAQAPKGPCTEFLNYVVTKSEQQAYYKAFNTLPVNKEAQGVVTDPLLKSVLAAYNKAPFVCQYLDTLFGENVGNALNTAVVNLMAGKGTVADIIKSVNEAAAKG